MELGLDQLMAIIGNKEVEIIGLRMQLAKAEQRIKELDHPPQENKADLKVVE